MSLVAAPALVAGGIGLSSHCPSSRGIYMSLSSLPCSRGIYMSL